MAHYAKVLYGKVVNMIVAEPEFFTDFIDDSPGEWVKCSYNIKNGVYYDPETNEPVADQTAALAADEARQRYNYPAVGWCYDGVGFYQEQPYKYWILDKTVYRWRPPFPAPDDGYGYAWSDTDYEDDTADPKTEGWVRITEDE